MKVLIIAEHKNGQLSEATRELFGLSLGQEDELLADFTMQPGRQYFLETAEALDGEWESMPGDVNQPISGGGGETIQIRIGALETSKNRFFRLRVKRLAE